ncbi:MAG TPA: stage II sporulation protein M [Pirellulales bacterium]|nr:stage II sporulation protein M [Pirellulales bacterium]
MKVAELLESRRENWRELERSCTLLESRRMKTLGPATVERFGTLYRAVCADLALADAYQLPPNTIQYLHQLVGRAHNQLYPSRRFQLDNWTRELLFGVPQRLFRDNALRLAFLLFWGVFLASMVSAYLSREFADSVVGKAALQQCEEMYDKPLAERHNEAGDFLQERNIMAGFYVQHNSTIGLRCFAAGLLLGIGGLYETVFNAVQLGAIFGHMATVPQRVNFFQFVTAHGPFELTAVVLAAAAGMRLGFSIVDTRGRTRAASLRLAAREAVPTVCASVLLFCLAALIEGYISPSALPYGVKASVAGLSTCLLLFYFIILGYPRSDDDAGADGPLPSEAEHAVG